MNIIIQNNSRVGYGKSKKAFELAKIVAKEKGLDFSMNNIVFNKEDFLKQIETKNNSVIVFDDFLKQ